MVEVWYEVTTYAGVATSFSFEAYEGTALIIKYAWDFDSDGVIDWESSVHRAANHTYDAPGTYTAAVHVYDTYGQVRMTTARVEVLSGIGEPAYEKAVHKYDWSYRNTKDRRTRTQNKALTDPTSTYWLLAAEGDSRFWHSIHLAYSRLVDTFCVNDTNIVVVVYCMPDKSWEECLEKYEEDSVIIDFGDLDSALAWIDSAVTSNDDLHMVFNCHGMGQFDSSVVIYDSDWGVPYELRGTGRRVFTDADDPDDPDLFCIESEYKYAWNWNKGLRKTYVGMDDWAGQYKPGEGLGEDKKYRYKQVATFSGMTFCNTEKTSDTDIYLEQINQFLVGDTNHDGYNDTCTCPWDCDGDGIPGIDTSGSGYVFDENEWGDYSLQNDPEQGTSGHRIVVFDDNFDGKADICWPCDYYTQNPVAHGTDSNDDGLFVGIDISDDGDMLDSVGVDELMYNRLDDFYAEFLDSLEYRKVTFMTSSCFGGGLIDDLSRSNVVVMSSCTDGMLGGGFISIMTQLLSGGMDHIDTCDFDGDGKVTFQEAFNAYGDLPGADGRHRLDDNGDEVGHTYDLPNNGDGYLANSLYWGTLPPTPPLPVLVYPGEDDIVANYLPTFIWSDTSKSCDSYDLKIAQWASQTEYFYGISDTSFRLPTCSIRLKLGFPYEVTWWVRSHMGCGVSGWSDSVVCKTEAYDCCMGDIRGNVDYDVDDVIDIADLVYLTDYMFESGCFIPCMKEADMDCDRLVSIADLVLLLDYMYYSGPPPCKCDCSDCQ